MGDPSHPPPTPQWRLWGQDPRVLRKTFGFVEKSGKLEKKVADLRQTRRSRVWGDQGGFSLNDFFSRNFLNHKAALILCLSEASAKQHLPLPGELLNQIRHLYSGLEVIKARDEGGSFLSQRHFIAETTSPVRSENKEQKPTTPAHSEQ